MDSRPLHRGKRKPKRKSGRRAAGRTRRAAAVFIRGTALAVAAVLLYLAGMSAWIHYYWKHTNGVPSDTAIVLGAAVWNNQPSPALRERLDIALELYEQGTVPRIIVTGGGSPGELTEAAMSRKYLTEHGVPADRIVLEDQSRSTVENLLNAQSIMKRSGMESAIVVTHGFHALRAKMMADHLGLPATVEPVQLTPLNLVYYTLRECAGIAFFGLQRWFV